MIKNNAHLARNLESGSKILLLILLFALPLFFFPATSDVFEINKQILLLVLTFSSALLWIGSMLVSKKVILKKGFVNIIPLFVLIPYFVSAFYSKDKYISWVGINSQEYTSVITIFGLVVLFYLVINLLKERAMHKKVHLILIISSSISALVAILSLFKISLFSFNSSFNTIGTINSLTVYLIAMSIFALSVWISHKKSDSLLHDGSIGKIEKALVVLLSLFTLFILLAVDYWVLWLLFVSGLITIFVFITLAQFSI